MGAPAAATVHDWHLVAADAARLVDPAFRCCRGSRPLLLQGSRSALPAPSASPDPPMTAVPERQGGYFGRGLRTSRSPSRGWFGHRSDRRDAPGDARPRRRPATLACRSPAPAAQSRCARASKLGQRLPSGEVNSPRARNGHDTRFAPARAAAKVRVMPLESFEGQRSEREATKCGLTPNGWMTRAPMSRQSSWPATAGRRSRGRRCIPRPARRPGSTPAPRRVRVRTLPAACDRHDERRRLSSRRRHEPRRR